MKPLNDLMAGAESTTTTSAGSSPAPAAPATSAPATSSDAGGAPAPVESKEGEDDWSGDLSTDDEGNATPAGKSAKPSAKPAPKATPAAKPVAAAIPAAPAPVAGEQPPAAAPAAPKPGEAAPTVQPAAAVVQQPPAAPAAKPGEQPPAVPAAAETPEVKAAREKTERATFEAKQHEQLVEYYKIPDEWAAKLATEPELVLPQLAAKLHEAVINGVRTMLDQGVPQVVGGMLEFQRRESAAKDAFYSRWPTLKQYETQVLQAGALFRQLNPKATPEERIERIGKIVSESLGIPVAPVPGGTTPSAGGTPPAPAFKPAGAGAAAGGRPLASANEFEAIAEELITSGE